jgi:hypothetical protein
MGTSDRITVQGWFASGANHIEHITVADDGRTLDHGQVDHLLQAMAGFKAPPMGQTYMPDAVLPAWLAVVDAHWSAAG